MDSSENFDSLFEGMDLIDPSSSSDQPIIISAPQEQQQQPLDENLFSDLTLFNTTISNNDDHDDGAAAADGDGDGDDDDGPTIATPSLLQSQPSPISSSHPLPSPSPPPTTTTPILPARQTSRKKKRGAIRIGYGRSVSDPDPNPLPKLPDSPSPQAVPSIEIDSEFSSREFDHPNQPPSVSISNASLAYFSDSHLSTPAPVADSEALEIQSVSEEDTKPSTDDVEQKDVVEEDMKPSTVDIEQKDAVKEPSTNTSQVIAAAVVVEDDQEEEEEEDDDDEAASSSIEVKLESIRARISEKLEEVRETAATVSTARKETARRRRKAAENVNLASAKYKDLEKQLEEACEAEDFERAESVSENLAAVEREKAGFLNALREAEADCDSMDSKMQEVLELQIAAEEEGVMLLQQFSKDAADNEHMLLSNAKELSSKEMEEWLSSTEALEIKRVELGIESHLINEARSGVKDFIEHSVEDDRKEKELLHRKRDVLTEELDKLLVLVRLKEAEIAENTSNIEEIEKRIANVVSGFHEAQLSIDTKYDKLQSAIAQIDLENEALSIKKKEVDELLSQTEEKGSKLKELASDSANEAKERQEFVVLRKNLASNFLNSRKDKVSLAKTEEKISEDVQILRQQVSAARASLQELSSTRASIQQDIASSKQRISFIEKRGPELEAEKKVAAAARNFKEAGRIAAEAKALSIEKEGMQNKMEKAIFELEKVEEEMKDTVNKLQESEALILSKEKEAAMAGCERLRLVAAAAMAERSAAIKLGDLEEANILLAEAEAADSEATKLQQAYEFKAVEVGEKNFISMALIVNLAGKELAEMAASVQPSAE